MQHGLSKVVPIAGRNKQLPILGHVLVQLKEGVMNLITTDLEIGVHTVVPGKVDDEGSCTVEARRLIDYVQQLPKSDPIQIEKKDQFLKVSTKGYQAQFPVMNDDDFPLLPSKPQGEGLSLGSSVFCDALSRTVFSAARDDTRPEIHSILLKRRNGSIVVAATDSFRLAEEMIDVSGSQDGDDLLLPLSTAQEVIRLFPSQEKVEMYPGDGYVVFSGDGLELSSRLVEGKYPDYQPIIPKEYSVTGTVDKDEFMRALKTMMVFLPRDSRRVYVSVKPEKEIMEMHVGGSESGEGRVELVFEGEGGVIDILFNIQYLIEGVQRIAGESVRVKLVGSSDPVVFGPVNNNDKYTYVVMPIQST